MTLYHDLFDDQKTMRVARGALLSDFNGVPSSLWDARAGWWQARKSAWISLGIRSELGRRGSPNYGKRETGGVWKLKTNRGYKSLAEIELQNKVKSRLLAESERQDRMKARLLAKDSSSIIEIKRQNRVKERLSLNSGHEVEEAFEISVENGAPITGISSSSIFDPVVCELAYRWFCPPEGIVLDPFAGGSVRGVVASLLGYHYYGIDLRDEQIASNEEQARAICGDPLPLWVCGDSLEMATLRGLPRQADFIFSCPPYFDLERYSDDPRDLSAQEWQEFLENYSAIIKLCAKRLRENRFACWVIGDCRDQRGLYRGLPWLTIDLFEQVGLSLYNQAVLVTMGGSLPGRMASSFRATRKLGFTHQYCFVFVKGDPALAALAAGAVRKRKAVAQGDDE